MDGFSVEDITNLSKLLGGNNEEQNQSVYYNSTGSVLNQGIFNNNKQKEVAHPNYKIELEVNRERNLTKPQNEIWKEDDLNEEIIEDDRLKPEFEVLYKQDVGTEDVYLGMSGKDPSSNCCDQLIMKIKLPKTSLKEISFEVKEKSVHLNVIFFQILDTIIRIKSLFFL